MAKSEKKPRKPNPLFITAVLITDRLRPDGVSDPDDRERVLKITMAGLSRLCGSKAAQNGKKVYDLTLVYLAWSALCDKAICEDWGRLPYVDAVTRSYSKSGYPWIEEWPKEVSANVPPVWDSELHDRYIEDNAPMLRLVGFKYKGGRIPISKLEELGLI